MVAVLYAIFTKSMSSRNNRATDDSSTHGNGEKSYEALFSRELHCAFTKAKVANKSKDASNDHDFLFDLVLLSYNCALYNKLRLQTK